MMLSLNLPFKVGLLILAISAASILWSQTQLTILAMAKINPVPETRQLVSEKRYAEAANYLNFFMAYDYVKDDPDARSLHADIKGIRNGLFYKIKKFVGGIMLGTSDELSGQIAGVIMDLFVIGDIRDLARQSFKWLKGDDPDEVIIALASIGTVASMVQVSTGGASTAVKGSTIILKIARKRDKLPTWLIKWIPEAAATVTKTKKLDSVTDLFGDVYSLAKVNGGINLLETTTDATSLKDPSRNNLNSRLIALSSIHGFR